jgi:S1-C subfamily serine protease
MRVPAYLVHLVLALVLAVGAFQWGTARAGAGAGWDRRRTAVVEAVDHVSPAVVSVDGTVGGRGWVTRSSGAGVIVHPDGYVVTNSHVIQGTTRVTVDRFGPGGRLPARVVADDPSGDLAILKIEAPGAPFPYVSCCPAKKLMLGETAIAIGNPHGLGDTVTVGVVSALGRQVKMAEGIVMRGLVQTDASINTGNSGGPLLNLDGELIGINVSVLPSAKGIAFAIGADKVQALVQRAVGRPAPRNALEEGAAPPAPAARPPLGAPPAAAPGRPAAAAPPWSGSPDGGLPAPSVAVPLRPSDFGLHVQDDGRRMVVVSVPPGTTAAVAGARVGDVLLAVDGHPVEDETDLLLSFSTSEPGRVYTLEIRRGAELKRLLLPTPR